MPDVQVIRDPFLPNRGVSPEVAQNPMRPAYRGCGCSPVSYNEQPSVGGSLAGVPAGNYRGGMGRTTVNMISRQSGSLASSWRSRPALGGLPCGTIRDVNTIVGGIAAALSSYGTSTNTKTGTTLSSTSGAVGSALSAGVGVACPPPSGPVVAAAPHQSLTDPTSGTQAYARELAAMAQAKAAAEAQTEVIRAQAQLAQKSNTTLYVAGGAAVAVILAVVLLR